MLTEQEYEKLIEPTSLFSTMNLNRFREWCKIYAIDDRERKESLKHALKYFENAEMYEHCKIIKEELDHFT